MRFGLCLAVLVVACREPQGSSVATSSKASAAEPAPSAASPRPTPSPGPPAPSSPQADASSAASPRGAPIEGCAAIEPRKVGLRSTAPLATTFSFEEGALAICIDSALYPYAPEKGHRLLTTFRARVGDDEQTYRGEGHMRLVFHGYSIEIGLEKASHSGQSVVWLEVDRSGADTKL